MSKTGGKKSKKWLIIVVVLVLVLLGGGAWIAYNLATSNSLFGPVGMFGAGSNTTPLYSKMTGYEIDVEAEQPIFCVQIPNGSTDGARPQVGLKAAAVVFEAIAETGITRFAAIYNTPPVMLGPIRSLRPYYLDWDTPFDCTIVHDGGSDEALAAVGNGNYRNLDEDFNYMWKLNYIGNQYRYWNNVFTSRDLLYDFNYSRGYTDSDPQTFPRLTPSEAADRVSEKGIIDCAEAARNDYTLNRDSCLTDNTDRADAHRIRITFSGLPDYNVVFDYNVGQDPSAVLNTYSRYNESSNGTLVPHKSIECAAKIKDPPTGCVEEQVAPNAIAVMRVQEHTMADGYHEQIQTIGSGEAYIFQNGDVITGRWQKTSQAEQIKFTDTEGNEIKFTPGQLWIAAVPQYGSVSWE